MKKLIDRSVIVATAVTLTLTFVASGTAIAGKNKNLSDQTQRELAEARRATARYLDINNAIADGYFDIGFFLPGVGCHLLNPALIDDVVDITAPEALIYEEVPGTIFCAPDGRLLSVEHIVPCGGGVDEDGPFCATPAPAGYSGKRDKWEPFSDGSIWTLHVWLWEYNPAGIFVKVNPDILGVDDDDDSDSDSDSD